MLLEILWLYSGDTIVRGTGKQIQCNYVTPELEIINPRCACATRVTVVAVCVCVCVCVCLSVCLFVKRHLTSGASVRPENAAIQAPHHG